MYEFSPQNYFFRKSTNEFLDTQTARTSTLVVGATKSVLDDAGLKKEKDRKRSSWYAGTINL